MADETENQESTMTLLQKQLDVERSRTASLKSELEMEKMKNQGMAMLFDCVQEERSENCRLKCLLKRRKLILCKLRKRLQADPSSVSQINWDELSDLSEGEEREFQTTLARQKSKQNSWEEKEPLCFENLGRSLKLSDRQVEDLQKRVEQLVRENEELQNQIRSSGTDKDAEILRLRKELCDVEKSRKVSGILCETLSEEAVTLKRHLAETVGMCQKLIRTLETKQNHVAMLAKERAATSLEKSSDVDVANPTFKQKYINLENKLKEVVTMNSRWQLYNEQREEYVQQLLLRNVELEQALVNRGQQLSVAQQEHIDQILIEHKQKLEMAREEKLMLEKENQELKRRIEEIQSAFRKSNSVVQELRERLNKEAAMHSKAIRTHVENNEALKLQVNMFQEDFQSERRDRERAQTHIAQLESQIRSASLQLNLNRPHTSPEQMRTVDPHTFVRHQSSLQETSLVGRGVVAGNSEDRSDSGELDLRPTD